MEKLIIIDANAYIHRVFHALPTMLTYKGTQINAVYGFVKLLFKFKKKIKPNYIVICFDYPAKYFRHEIYKDYKKNRLPSSKKLVGQIPIIKEALEVLNIKSLELKGYEADDLIATIVELTKNNNLQKIIITGDKDLLQLVNNNEVVVWNDSQNTMYNSNKIKEKYGINPKQIIDVLALMGDIVDNIPGIKGIGKKTAIKLIKNFCTLENLFHNINIIKGKLNTLLHNGLEKSRLSKKLIELNKNVPINIKIDDLKVKQLNLQKFLSFLEKYELYSFLKEFKKG
ncbi:MAG: hypothetical protein LBL53_02115 [Endomicrobium sp.]|jgi:DNA polymerase-1|nr:hypothetical protein [Endomicrobium sp.]